MQKKTVDFLNETVELPGYYQIPNWLRIIIQNSSPTPFRINRNDGDLFDRLHRDARYVPEHEAIVRLLGMIAYQDIQVKKLEAEITRLKMHFVDHILEGN